YSWIVSSGIPKTNLRASVAIQRAIEKGRKKNPWVKVVYVGNNLTTALSVLGYEPENEVKSVLLSRDPVKSLVVIPMFKVLFGYCETRAQFVAALLHKYLDPNLDEKILSDALENPPGMPLHEIKEKISETVPDTSETEEEFEARLIDELERFLPMSGDYAVQRYLLEMQLPHFLAELRHECWDFPWLQSEAAYHTVRMRMIDGDIQGVVGNMWLQSAKNVLNQSLINPGQLVFFDTSESSWPRNWSFEKWKLFENALFKNQENVYVLAQVQKDLKTNELILQPSKEFFLSAGNKLIVPPATGQSLGGELGLAPLVLNRASLKQLQERLAPIPGIRPKSIAAIAQSIIHRRPFDSPDDLRKKLLDTNFDPKNPGALSKNTVDTLIKAIENELIVFDVPDLNTTSKRNLLKILSEIPGISPEKIDFIADLIIERLPFTRDDLEDRLSQPGQDLSRPRSLDAQSKQALTRAVDNGALALTLFDINNALSETIKGRLELVGIARQSIKKITDLIIERRPFTRLNIEARLSTPGADGRSLDVEDVHVLISAIDNGAITLKKYRGPSKIIAPPVRRELLNGGFAYENSPRILVPKETSIQTPMLDHTRSYQWNAVLKHLEGLEGELKSDRKTGRLPIILFIPGFTLFDLDSALERAVENGAQIQKDLEDPSRLLSDVLKDPHYADVKEKLRKWWMITSKEANSFFSKLNRASSLASPAERLKELQRLEQNPDKSVGLIPLNVFSSTEKVLRWGVAHGVTFATEEKTFDGHVRDNDLARLGRFVLWQLSYNDLDGANFYCDLEFRTTVQNIFRRNREIWDSVNKVRTCLKPKNMSVVLPLVKSQSVDFRFESNPENSDIKHDEKEIFPLCRAVSYELDGSWPAGEREEYLWAQVIGSTLIDSIDNQLCYENRIAAVYRIFERIKSRHVSVKSLVKKWGARLFALRESAIVFDEKNIIPQAHKILLKLLQDEKLLEAKDFEVLFARGASLGEKADNPVEDFKLHRAAAWVYTGEKDFVMAFRELQEAVKLLDQPNDISEEERSDFYRQWGDLRLQMIYEPLITSGNRASYIAANRLEILKRLLEGLADYHRALVFNSENMRAQEGFKEVRNIIQNIRGMGQDPGPASAKSLGKSANLGPNPLFLSPETQVQIDLLWKAMGEKRGDHFFEIIHQLRAKHGLYLDFHVFDEPFTEKLEHFFTEYGEFVHTAIHHTTNDETREGIKAEHQGFRDRFTAQILNKMGEFALMKEKLYKNQFVPGLVFQELDEYFSNIQNSIRTAAGLLAEIEKNLENDQAITDAFSPWTRFESDELGAFKVVNSQIRHESINGVQLIRSHPILNRPVFMDSVYWATVHHLLGNLYQHVTRGITKAGERWGEVLIFHDPAFPEQYMVVSLDNGKGIKNIDSVIRGDAYSAGGAYHEALGIVENNSKSFSVTSGGRTWIKDKGEFADPDQKNPGTKIVVVGDASNGASLGHASERLKAHGPALNVRQLFASQFRNLSSAIRELFDRQMYWPDFFKIIEDGKMVEYVVFLPGQQIPLRYFGSVPHEALAEAELVMLHNIMRAARPGVHQGRLQTHDPRTRKLVPKQVTETPRQFFLEWLSSDRRTWFAIFNPFAIWPPKINQKFSVQPLHLTLSRGDGDIVPQTEMSQKENIQDILEFLTQVNQSRSQVNEEPFRISVNGWYASDRPDAPKGGASQYQAHAHLVRFPFPVERAICSSVEKIGGVLVSLLDNSDWEAGWGSALVLEAPHQSIQQLAVVISKALALMRDNHHSFSLLATSLPNERLRVFLYERTQSAPGSYFPNEWGYSEISRVVLVDDPRTFYSMTDSQSEEFNSLRETMDKVDWLKKQREWDYLHVLNPNLRANVLKAHRLVNGDRESLAAIVNALRSEFTGGKSLGSVLQRVDVSRIEFLVFKTEAPDFIKAEIEKIKKQLGSEYQRDKNNILFTTTSSFSDEIISPYTVSAIRAMLTHEKDFKGRDVVDFGAGNGILSLVALHLGARRVMLVDLNQSQLENARNLLEEQGWREDKGYGGDFVLLNADLNQVDLDRLAQKFWKPDSSGIVLANVGPWEMYGGANQRLAHIISNWPVELFINGGYRFPDADHEIEARDIQKQFEAQGFSVRESELQIGVGRGMLTLIARKTTQAQSLGAQPYRASARIPRIALYGALAVGAMAGGVGILAYRNFRTPSYEIMPALKTREAVIAYLHSLAKEMPTEIERRQAEAFVDLLANPEIGQIDVGEMEAVGTEAEVNPEEDPAKGSIRKIVYHVRSLRNLPRKMAQALLSHEAQHAADYRLLRETIRIQKDLVKDVDAFKKQEQEAGREPNFENLFRGRQEFIEKLERFWSLRVHQEYRGQVRQIQLFKRMIDEAGGVDAYLAAHSFAPVIHDGIRQEYQTMTRFYLKPDGSMNEPLVKQALIFSDIVRSSDIYNLARAIELHECAKNPKAFAPDSKNGRARPRTGSAAFGFLWQNRALIDEADKIANARSLGQSELYALSRLSQRLLPLELPRGENEKRDLQVRIDEIMGRFSVARSLAFEEERLPVVDGLSRILDIFGYVIYVLHGPQSLDELSWAKLRMQVMADLQKELEGLRQATVKQLPLTMPARSAQKNILSKKETASNPRRVAALKSQDRAWKNPAAYRQAVRFDNFINSHLDVYGRYVLIQRLNQHLMLLEKRDAKTGDAISYVTNVVGALVRPDSPLAWIEQVSDLDGYLVQPFNLDRWSIIPTVGLKHAFADNPERGIAVHRWVMSENGRYAAKRHIYSNIVQVWDLERGKKIHEAPVSVPEARGGATADLIGLSDDGHRLIMSFYVAPPSNHDYWLWDFEDSKNSHRIGRNTISFFAPDGVLLISQKHDSFRDFTSHVWDSKFGQRLFDLEHSSEVSLFRHNFNSLGNRLIAGQGSQIIIWDLTTGKQLSHYELPAYGLINAVALSPDGKVAFVGDETGRVRIVSVSNSVGFLLGEIPGTSGLGRIEEIEVAWDGSAILVTGDSWSHRDHPRFRAGLYQVANVQGASLGSSLSVTEAALSKLATIDLDKISDREGATLKDWLEENLAEVRDSERKPPVEMTFEELSQRLREHQPLIENPPAPIMGTPVGDIDLSRLNDITRYKGYDAYAQLALDLTLAHYLRLIRIKRFRGPIAPRMIQSRIRPPFFSEPPAQISSTVSDWLRIKYALKNLNGNTYEGDENQIKFYAEVFGKDIDEKHLGNLCTAVPVETKRRLKWSRLDLNYSDVISVRQKVTEIFSDATKREIYRGYEGQIRFYRDLFGEGLNGKFLGNLYSTVPNTVKRGLNWPVIRCNGADIFEKIPAKPRLNGFSRDQSKSPKVLPPLSETAQKEFQEKVRQILASAKKELEFWGDSCQIQLYEATLGKSVRGKRLDLLYDALPISEEMKQKHKWHRLGFDYGRIEDIRTKVAEIFSLGKQHLENYKGDRGQFRFLQEVFKGEDIDDEHLVLLNAVIPSFEIKKLIWRNDEFRMLKLKLRAAVGASLGEDNDKNFGSDSDDKGRNNFEQFEKELLEAIHNEFWLRALKIMRDIEERAGEAWDAMAPKFAMMRANIYIMFSNGRPNAISILSSGIIALAAEMPKTVQNTGLLQWLYFLRGKNYFAEKKFAAAVHDFSSALNIKLNDVEKKDLLEMRGMTYLEMSDWRSARRDFEEIIKTNSTPVPLSVYLGLAYAYSRLKLEKLEVVVWQIMDHAFQCEAKVDYYRALMALDINELETAQRKISDALSKAIHTDVIPILRLRGEIYLKMRQFKKAGDDFRKLLSLDPTNTDVMIKMAVILSRKNGSEEAKSLLETALAVRAKKLQPVKLNMVDVSRVLRQQKIEDTHDQIWDRGRDYFLSMDSEQYIDRTATPTQAEISGKRMLFELEREDDLDQKIQGITAAISQGNNSAEIYASRAEAYMERAKKYREDKLNEKLICLKAALFDFATAAEKNQGNAELKQKIKDLASQIEKMEKNIFDQIRKNFPSGSDDATGPVAGASLGARLGNYGISQLAILLIGRKFTR
ncbi:MAG: 50S ribosomal protein L11 methyltransferase, partial [Candidatus Omnitrophica bacterium]|nr:50S ribosomal protein L11 methyltransferase [Candidatus Omnitrophota bacterium]